MMNDQKCVVSNIVPNLELVMEMIEKNIFRPLPNKKKSTLAMSETGIEQEEQIDPSWPHLQVIYFQKLGNLWVFLAGYFERRSWCEEYEGVYNSTVYTRSKI